MEITKRDVLILNTGLNEVGHLTGLKFVYAVAKNLSIIKDEVAILQKSSSYNEDFITFQLERVKLAEEHAVVEKGIPQKILDGGNEKFIIEDRVSFNKEFDALKTKHGKALDGRVKQLKDFDKLLDEKVELDIYVISREIIPKEITARQMSNIFNMIEVK